MSTLISATDLTKYYGTKNNKIKALGPVNLKIEKGTYTLILGRSGSGKSTLLNLMAGLDKPTDGVLKVGDDELNKYNSKELARYRGKIGIIFQFYNLLPNLDALENVLMAGWAAGKNPSTNQAKELLTKLSLEHRINANVKTLSGGEKQRVAIARALLDGPGIIFCDEPTGALDSVSELQVQEILTKLHKEEGKTIVMVSHNPDFRKYADRMITMQDGEIIKEEVIKN